MFGSNRHKLVVLYTGAHIATENGIIKEDLWVHCGKVIDPATVDYNADRVVDMTKRLIAPGFIDLKLNGCFGVDFSEHSDLEQQKFDDIRIKIGQFGVTSFLTCVTPQSSAEKYHELLPTLSSLIDRSKGTPGAKVLGIHLDGPIQSKLKSVVNMDEMDFSENVTNDENCEFDESVSLATIDGVEAFYGSLNNVRLISIAPELPGMVSKVIPALIKRGIKVSLGHTVCTITQGEAAVRAGASIIGHLFNAMPAFHHRDPSLIGLLSSTEIGDRDVRFGLIADLVHTHPASLVMAHKLKNHMLMVVSDAVLALGLHPPPNDENIFFSRTQSNGVEIQVRESPMRPSSSSPAVAAYYGASDDLFGSCTGIDQAVRNLLIHTDMDLADAIAAATIRPAQALGIADTKGSLNFGSDADFIVLDRDLNVRMTFAEGDLIYNKSKTDRVGMQGALYRRVTMTLDRI